MNKNEIIVSIICNTYNQVKYIRDALEGFINQKTSFQYEILIHDDASNDGTVDIIKEYEMRYPDLIFPYYQKENKYSQKISITINYQYPRVRGKYIAFCEGDDYWVDSSKLQRQYDLMEKYSNINVCAHAVNAIEANTGKILKVISPYKGKKVIPLNRVLKGEYVGTCSLMFRREALIPVSESLQQMHFDYAMRIQGALNGGMLYIDDIMASYRSKSDGSWTQNRDKNKKSIAAYENEIINMLKVFDKQTNNKYSKAITKEIDKLNVLVIYNNSEESIFKIFRQYSLKQKIIVIILIIQKIIQNGYNIIGRKNGK